MLSRSRPAITACPINCGRTSPQILLKDDLGSRRATPQRWNQRFVATSRLLQQPQRAVADWLGAWALILTRVEWLFASASIYRLRTLDVEIHDHRILPASNDHSFTRHIWTGVNFLMRDVGRNVNEIARVCLTTEL